MLFSHPESPSWEELFPLESFRLSDPINVFVESKNALNSSSLACFLSSTCSNSASVGNSKEWKFCWNPPPNNPKFCWQTPPNYPFGFSYRPSFLRTYFGFLGTPASILIDVFIASISVCFARQKLACSYQVCEIFCLGIFKASHNFLLVSSVRHPYSYPMPMTEESYTLASIRDKISWTLSSSGSTLDLSAANSFSARTTLASLASVWIC